MLFTDGPKGKLASEWHEQLHPETRSLVLALENWSTDEGIHPPVLTQICRDVPSQIGIYVAYWSRCVEAYQAGEKQTPADQKAALKYQHKTVEELAIEARGRFTWHEVKCAVDIRTRHYAEPELKKVVAFLMERIARPGDDGRPQILAGYEFLEHDIHGPHLHLAVRDFSYRAKFDPRHQLPGVPNV